MKRVLAVLLVSVVMSLAQAQPTTRAVDEDVDVPPNAGLQGLGYQSALKLTLATQSSPPTIKEIKELLQNIHWRSAAAAPVAGVQAHAYQVEKGEATVSIEPTVYQVGQDEENVDVVEQVNVFVEKMKALAGKSRGMPEQELQQKLTQVDQQLADTRSKMDALASLRQAREEWLAQVRRKVSDLQSQRSQLDMALAAKLERREALEQGIANFRAEAQHAETADEISEQLKKVISARQHEWELMKSKLAAASSAEVASAEVSLAESKIRLAERQAQIARGSKGELLDRLANELAMLSIDVTELQLQRGRLEEELTKYSPSKIGVDLNEVQLPGLASGQLAVRGGGGGGGGVAYGAVQPTYGGMVEDELKKQDPSKIGQAELERLAQARKAHGDLPIGRELQKQYVELLKEKFGLQVADVQLVPPEKN